MHLWPEWIRVRCLIVSCWRPLVRFPPRLHPLKLLTYSPVFACVLPFASLLSPNSKPPALLVSLSTMPSYNPEISQPSPFEISLISENVNYLFLEPLYFLKIIGCIRCFSRHMMHHTPLSLLYTVIAASRRARRRLVVLICRGAVSRNPLSNVDGGQ